MSETEGTEMDEQGQDTSSPPEPEMPQAGREVAPEEPASLPLPGIEPYEPPAPLEPAEPGIYWCEEADPGSHFILGRLVEGENDFTEVTHPESLMAIAALVQAGVLVKV